METKEGDERKLVANRKLRGARAVHCLCTAVVRRGAEMLMMLVMMAFGVCQSRVRVARGSFVSACMHCFSYTGYLEEKGRLVWDVRGGDL
jgi:hypothetical protein